MRATNCDMRSLTIGVQTAHFSFLFVLGFVVVVFSLVISESLKGMRLGAWPTYTIGMCVCVCLSIRIAQLIGPRQEAVQFEIQSAKCACGGDTVILGN